jgi:glycosyltransferase involved in cell wall biosynthesis
MITQHGHGMRILVAHQVPSQRTGGMSRIMGFIHDEIVSSGHQVDYFCAEDVPIGWRGSLGRRFGFQLLLRRAAVEAARRGSAYDIVNVHEPDALPITRWKRAAGSPMVVITSHGLGRRAWELAKEESQLGREGPAWTTHLTYPLTSLWPAEMALRGADHIFCLSNDDRTYLEHEVGRSRESVTRIFPAADPIYGTVSEGRDYKRAKRVLFAATWRKNKGIEDLVPAFVQLADRHPGLSLAVVSAGVHDDLVRASFPERLRSRVGCFAPRGEKAMAEAFADADLFLLPSLFEGTPLTIVQAMMSGLPIVATGTCGMKDVIADNLTGLQVPIRNPDAIVASIERLMDDEPLRARLGSAARAEALSRYTWDRVAVPVRHVYERLHAARGGSPAERRSA